MVVKMVVRPVGTERRACRVQALHRYGRRLPAWGGIRPLGCGARRVGGLETASSTRLSLTRVPIEPMSRVR